MATDTLVFFKHDDPSGWRNHFAEVCRILSEFGAQCRKFEFGEHIGSYSCELLNNGEMNYKDVEFRSRVVSQGYEVKNLYCDDLCSLPDSSLLNASAYFGRTRVPLPAPVTPKETQIPRKDVTISIRYDSLLYDHYPSTLPRSPGVFSMVFPVPLDPMHAYSYVRSGMINYLEILEFYELVKKIHVEVGFSITCGCLRDYFNVFGVTESDSDYDNLFRFDTRGVNRLNSAYEEMRELAPGDDKRYINDNKLLFSVVTEYDHPVPIILRDPINRMK
jgi:hypothetical protein